MDAAEAQMIGERSHQGRRRPESRQHREAEQDQRQRGEQREAREQRAELAMLRGWAWRSVAVVRCVADAVADHERAEHGIDQLAGFGGRGRQKESAGQ